MSSASAPLDADWFASTSDSTRAFDLFGLGGDHDLDPHFLRSADPLPVPIGPMELWHRGSDPQEVSFDAKEIIVPAGSAPRS